MSVIPAGAIDTSSNTWCTKSGNFLFPEKALAKVFRGKWFQAMKEQGWKVSETLPMKWVVDCKRVGNGDKALTYLGRYLYRGVLREKDILHCENGEVTFRYTENSGNTRTRTLDGADFLWLLLRHVLPRAFAEVGTTVFFMATTNEPIQLLHLLLRCAYQAEGRRPPL